MGIQNLGLHHQQTRKRIYKNLEVYPHTDKHKNFVDKLVYISSILTPIFTLPQVLKIWIYKSASDVSLFTWGPYLVFAAIWLWYGILHKDKPLIVLNGGLVAVNVAIIVGILLFE